MIDEGCGVAKKPAASQDGLLFSFPALARASSICNAWIWRRNASPQGYPSASSITSAEIYDRTSD
jgi:hypothetical protein